MSWRDWLWPRLTHPARVEGRLFRPGASTRLVVLAAVRAASRPAGLPGPSARVEAAAAVLAALRAERDEHTKQVLRQVLRPL